MKTPQTVKKQIKARQVMLGLSNSDMACHMHMSLSSWNRRLRHPEGLTLQELLRLEKILKFKLLEKEEAS